jgi:flagellar biosynthesis chaperone FliJ
MTGSQNKITVRSLLLGALFAALFAALTVVLENRQSMLPTANQIPLFPYVLLVLAAGLVNPLCRLVRIVRPFSTAELMIVFVMGIISSGISTFGLTGQLVPVIGSLFNRHWNHDQSEWNRYVEPYVNEGYFISEPGIRTAARAYAQALGELQGFRNELQEQARRDHAKGRTESAEANAIQAKVDEAEQNVAAKRQALDELENKAAEKVERFRRGLPRGMRAFPGIVPTTDDDASAYFRRLGRLWHGRKAAGAIEDVFDILKGVPADAPPPAEAAKGVRGMLEAAADYLKPSAQAQELQAIRTSLREAEAELTGEISEIKEEVVGLNKEKRSTSVEHARDLQDQIDRLNKRRARLERNGKTLARKLERNQRQIDACGRVAEAVAELDALAPQAPTLTSTEMKARLDALLDTFPSFDASFRRYFFGDIPWGDWIRPICHWGLLILLTYVVLQAFNVLIFRQWAYNEKLIFPLAELPELLAGRGEEGSWVPSVFRNGLFWVGFAISAGVMGWNVLCASGAMPGLKPLDLNNSWTPYVANSALRGLVGTRSMVFFTMIGVAFLIPKKVSFSLWFFHVLFLIQLLLLVAFGRGQNINSFPSEWWYTLNFRTAEGGGALLVFASLVLWKCRRFIFCSLRPRSVADIPEAERRELLICSVLFLAGSLGIILILCGSLGVNWFYALFGYGVIVVITIGLVRAVAEGGILGFQAWVSPFHFIRHLIGYNKTISTPSLFAPLMAYYAILFQDIKTFIAPAMANGLKIRDDLGMSRKRYHFAVALGILVACVVAIGTAVMMCYASGADAMHNWFYNQFPRDLFDRIANISRVPPTATPEGRFYLGFGAILMAALLYFRQSLFWLPHPIGLIMLVNPLMNAYWFSILIGWLAKSLVTKYGNKDTYTKVRGAFIGLIVGELVVVAIAMFVSLHLQRNLGIDLNRQ